MRLRRGRPLQAGRRQRWYDDRKQSAGRRARSKFAVPCVWSRFASGGGANLALDRSASDGASQKGRLFAQPLAGVAMRRKLGASFRVDLIVTGAFPNGSREEIRRKP